jgi:G patch domain-containing protein 1
MRTGGNISSSGSGGGGGGGAHPKRPLQAGKVTDEQGRVRFHGAFTGGFSAGYFNTVGSEEGFKPKTFVSSRENRASKQSM